MSSERQWSTTHGSSDPKQGPGPSSVKGMPMSRRWTLASRHGSNNSANIVEWHRGHQVGEDLRWAFRRLPTVFLGIPLCGRPSFAASVAPALNEEPASFASSSIRARSMRRSSTSASAAASCVRAFSRGASSFASTPPPGRPAARTPPRPLAAPRHPSALPPAAGSRSSFSAATEAVGRAPGRRSRTPGRRVAQKRALSALTGHADPARLRKRLPHLAGSSPSPRPLRPA